MCTRVFDTIGDEILTARTMDWHSSLDTNIWFLPKGRETYSLQNKHAAGRFKWTSLYSSLCVGESFPNDSTVKSLNEPYNVYTTTPEGINDQGLVASALWLSESDYGDPEKHEGKLHLSIAAWAQYMLDNYSSVEEAVKAWSKKDFCIVSREIPGEGGKCVNMHLALSDAHNKSAIFEYYLDEDTNESCLHITTNLKGFSGKRHHHTIVKTEANCDVLTNSPVYEQQLKLNYYWQWQWNKQSNPNMQSANQASETQTLPGTSRAADRFARASFYLHEMRKMENTKRQSSYQRSVGQAFSLMKTVSVPLNYFSVDKASPNISNTLWTSVCDSTNKRLFLQVSEFPNLIWIDFEGFTEYSGTEPLIFRIGEETGVDPSKESGEINYTQMHPQQFEILLSSQA